MLEVGQKAPDFNLLDENGENMSLSTFKGKNIVLYFYPKDDTPGCTKESIAFSELKK
ncbi:redoxin domain-containing protein [Emcibacteraceae bacterium]|nr:redoxin domain-containing protein [Emcibacteraceae bacterium]